MERMPQHQREKAAEDECKGCLGAAGGDNDGPARSLLHTRKGPCSPVYASSSL